MIKRTIVTELMRLGQRWYSRKQYSHELLIAEKEKCNEMANCSSVFGKVTIPYLYAMAGII